MVAESLPTDRPRRAWSRILAMVSSRSRIQVMAPGVGSLRSAHSIPARVAKSAAASSRTKPIVGDDIAVAACHFMVRIRSSRASQALGGFLNSNSEPGIASIAPYYASEEPSALCRTGQNRACSDSYA